ncbi:8864_t:CDS:10 [Funneliformis geosporum]|nr:8864_t:CDS:10 [Funneliformis geosporum]
MDLFKILGSGARFNKNRFNEDITLFEPSNRSKKVNETVDNKSDTQMDLIQEIDFFHNSKSAINETLGISKSKTKEITESLEEVQEEEEGIEQENLMAMAPTGSGKTLAYILPILYNLKGPEKMGYRALIISPTRELAQQIYREIKKMSIGKKFKICMLTKATASTQAQAPQLREKFDILISTPLRLVHAIQEENIELKNVRHLILDEADKLLELGFLEQTDEIFAACSNMKLQKSLFSATLPSGVEALANNFMKDPIRVVVGLRNAATETIKQKLVYVGQEEGKLIAIRQLIQEGLKPPVLIFVQSIERAKELFHELIYDGINVDVIHSERTKAQRDSIVLKFRQGKIWVLIATELMARGMDFKGVNLVINYDFPQSVQSYIHRIGRTGRAGRAGEAATYYTKDDAPYLKSIVNVMRDSGCEVPEWMIQLKNPSKVSKQQLRKKPIERKTITSKKRKARKLASTANKYGDKDKKEDIGQLKNDDKTKNNILTSSKPLPSNKRRKRSSEKDKD